jgi:aryl-alcohol dehydrogenase-like predicted oxidoreductase
LEGSLSRLQTGFVDVLLLHNPPTELLNQASPAFIELEKLKQEGKIRAYGASLSGSLQLKAALDKAVKSKKQEDFEAAAKESKRSGIQSSRNDAIYDWIAEGY